MELVEQIFVNDGIGTCGEKVAHVWFSSKIPPDENARCECGAVTWREGLEKAYRRAVELERTKERLR